MEQLLHTCAPLLAKYIDYTYIANLRPVCNWALLANLDQTSVTTEPLVTALL